MSDREYMFTSGITFPDGARVDVTVYIPESEAGKDVLETTEATHAALARVASSLHGAHKAVPF